MLFDTSKKDKNTKQKINDLVGAPYNLFQTTLQGKGGRDSSKMEVIEYSKLFDKIMSQSAAQAQAKISIRPFGIVLTIFIRSKIYSWVIPYRFLSIIKTDILVIHGQGEYLKLAIDGEKGSAYISKLMKLKQ
ncbi:MAG: hypothetical protein WEA99_11230 [Brumimicrobium sp.]